MKKIGEIKDEFTAAKEADWQSMCNQYREDSRSGVQKLILQYEKKIKALEAEKLRMEQMMQMGLAFARKNGYQPYYMYRQKNTAGYAGSSGQENIGFAREGKECLYNILIMEERTDIIGIGAGSSSKLIRREGDLDPVTGETVIGNRIDRVENCKSVDDYIARIDEMIERKNRQIFNGR